MLIRKPSQLMARNGNRIIRSITINSNFNLPNSRARLTAATCSTSPIVTQFSAFSALSSRSACLSSHLKLNSKEIDSLSSSNRSYSQPATDSSLSSTSTPSPSSLTSLATTTAGLFIPAHSWFSRITESAHKFPKANSRPLKIAVVGSTRSQTFRFIEALLDEPLSYSPKRSSEDEEQQAASAERATAISLIQQRRQLAASLESQAELGKGFGENTRSAMTEGLTIQYSPSAHLIYSESASDASGPRPVLGLPLSWLRDGAGLELIELLDPSSTPSESLLSTLYSSDLILFHTDISNLCSTFQKDPVLLLLSRFAEKPGTRLIVDDSADSTSLDLDSTSLDLDSALEKVVGPVTLQELKDQIRFTNPQEPLQSSAATLVATRLALRANTSLRTALESEASSSSSAAAWESFRSNHMASNFPSIKALISPANLPAPAISASDSLTFLIRHALSSAVSQISSAREEMSYSRGAANALREMAQGEMEAKAEEVLDATRKWAGRNSNLSFPKAKPTSSWKIPGLDQILGRNKDVAQRSGDLPASSLSVGESAAETSERGPLASSAGAISSTLGSRLAWWKVAGLGRVDDVRTEVEGAVVAGWGRGAEERLIFEAGRILSAAEDQYQRTTSILDNISSRTRSSLSLQNLSASITPSGEPASPMSSSLLRNSVEAHSPSRLQMFSSPLLLSSAIAQRRAQLTSPGGPLDALVRGGQKAVLQSWTIGATGVTTSLIGLGTGAGLRFGLFEALPGFTLSSIAMTPSTSFALALFSVLLASWRMQGLWTKEKKRFWRRWESVANGLETDVQNQLRRVLENGVFVTPIKAAEGIEELVLNREERIKMVERELGIALRMARDAGVLKE